MIMQVTNKVLLFFSPKEILLDSTFSISTSFLKNGHIMMVKIFFQFQYRQTLKFFYLYLYVMKKFYFVKLAFSIKFMASFLLIPLMQ